MILFPLSRVIYILQFLQSPHEEQLSRAQVANLLISPFWREFNWWEFATYQSLSQCSHCSCRCYQGYLTCHVPSPRRTQIDLWINCWTFLMKIVVCWKIGMGWFPHKKIELLRKVLKMYQAKVLFNLMDNLALSDVWGYKNGESKEYVYFSKRHRSFSRLDR